MCKLNVFGLRRSNNNYFYFFINIVYVIIKHMYLFFKKKDQLEYINIILDLHEAASLTKTFFSVLTTVF